MSDAPLYLSILRRFILGVALTIASFAAHSQSAVLQGDQISATTQICPRPIRVAFYDIGPFFNPTDGTGIDKDVITALQERTHCHFDLVFESRVRIWKMLASGALDMTVSGISNPERREFAYFMPYYRARNELVMLATGSVPVSPAAFLADQTLKLGVVKSYAHGPGWDEWIAKLRASGRVVDVADSRDLFRQLDIGHVQAIPVWHPVSVTVGERYPMQHQITRLHWFSDYPDVEYCLVLSKKTGSDSFGLHKFLAENMAEMRKDGTLKKIYRRYMNDEDTNLMLLL